MSKHYKILHIPTGTFLFRGPTHKCFSEDHEKIGSFDIAQFELKRFISNWSSSPLFTSEQYVHVNPTLACEYIYQPEEFLIMEFED